MIENKINNKKENLLPLLNYFKQEIFIIENNLKRDEERLKQREKLGKERGIKEPIIVPEGYIDMDKDLKEDIKISKEQLKENKELIKNIVKQLYLSPII